MRTFVLLTVRRIGLVAAVWFVARATLAPSIEVQILGSALAVIALEMVFIILSFYTKCAVALRKVWGETRRTARGLVERWQVLVPMRVFAPAGMDGFDVYVRAKPRRWAKRSKTPFLMFAVTCVLRIACSFVPFESKYFLKTFDLIN